MSQVLSDFIRNNYCKNTKPDLKKQTAIKTKKELSELTLSDCLQDKAENPENWYPKSKNE
ncbi:hypothetical protein NO1_1724 [Candidatus Termititenax aidoneus]|uniref:Uncharacterized protein n=1 Tax=Termititenax aidoneus TaxID=2218524 RepID=A0A388TDE6_TERA1|nr:hypothetical protein NO1_1724 [Candidatus Termititenax aidoneus]